MFRWPENIAEMWAVASTPTHLKSKKILSLSSTHRQVAAQANKSWIKHTKYEQSISKKRLNISNANRARITNVVTCSRYRRLISSSWSTRFLRESEPRFKTSRHNRWAGTRGQCNRPRHQIRRKEPNVKEKRKHSQPGGPARFGYTKRVQWETLEPNAKRANNKKTKKTPNVHATQYKSGRTWKDHRGRRSGDYLPAALLSMGKRNKRSERLIHHLTRLPMCCFVLFSSSSSPGRLSKHGSQRGVYIAPTRGLASFLNRVVIRWCGASRRVDCVTAAFSLIIAHANVPLTLIPRDEAKRQWAFRSCRA